MLSPKVTERLLHICGDLSASASPSHPLWEGRPWGTHSNGFPYEGKLSPEATDEVTAPRRRKCLHLIRLGFAVPAPLLLFLCQRHDGELNLGDGGEAVEGIGADGVPGVEIAEDGDGRAVRELREDLRVRLRVRAQA